MNNRKANYGALFEPEILRMLTGSELTITQIAKRLRVARKDVQAIAKKHKIDRRGSCMGPLLKRSEVPKVDID